MATKHNRYAVHNHDSKDLEYDLTSQKRTSLNQTNDHLDVQVYVQIRVTRHPYQTRISRYSQTRLNTRRSPTNTEKPDIANRFEIGLISLGISLSNDKNNKFMSMIPAFWDISLQGETGQEI